MTARAAPAWALELLDTARVGRLATADPAGRPALVPVCFVYRGGNAYTPIDGKPKSTRRLRRVRDVEANPTAVLLVDHYEEDWRRLAWVQVRGAAGMINGDEAREALDALRSKYPQYAEVAVGPEVIRIAGESVRAWRAAPTGVGSSSAGGR